MESVNRRRTKEKVQNDTQRSTKHTHKTKDRVTYKHGDKLCLPAIAKFVTKNAILDLFFCRNNSNTITNVLKVMIPIRINNETHFKASAKV